MRMGMREDVDCDPRGTHSDKVSTKWEPRMFLILFFFPELTFARSRFAVTDNDILGILYMHNQQSFSIFRVEH